MSTNPIPRAEPLKSVRDLAMRLNNRAWDLVELERRTAKETIEMVDAAYGSRALWRMATDDEDSVERLRAHHVVACACARARYGDQALRAARMAAEHERRFTRGISEFDRAMTLVSMHLALLLHPGAPIVEPLMTLIDGLEPDEAEVLSRLLPWPRFRTGQGTQASRVAVPT